MAMLLGIAIIGSTVTGGIAAAQNYCKYQQETADVIAQTNNVVTQSGKIYDALLQQDNTVLDEMHSLQTASLAASNNLIQLRKNYVTNLEKYRLIALIVIIIVFMLLLGKKMKLL